MSGDQVVDGGVYLEVVASKVGTGDTAKDATMQNYWRASVKSDEVIKMILLDNNDQPTTYSEDVNFEEFNKRFVLQQDFQPRQVNLKKDMADKISSRAERHLEEKEYLSAEFEFSNALKHDDRNLRANLGLGKTYMATGDEEKAKEALKKLATIDEVFEPEQKHIFNDFAIQLRKLGMFKEAVQNYKRALELTQNDENLWFNLGRALFESGQYSPAVSALKRALKLNPEFEEAKAFIFAAQKKM
ncbi:MAG: tetratricopeptide repeat protein [Desulfarculaceae bacterium]|jgi:tetratricopeptide (TPR) repeat protein